MEKGLVTKSAAPWRMASTALSTEPWAVIRTTVVSAWSAFTRRSSSIPSSEGMTRSVTTTSCRYCSNSASALTPSAATSTVHPSLRRRVGHAHPEQGLVLGDQEAVAAGRHQASSVAGASVGVGKRTRKIEPSPSWVSTSIPPP